MGRNISFPLSIKLPFLSLINYITFYHFCQVFDEIFENNSIEVWDIDECIELKINCRGCASENNPEMLIPYALFATFEMAPDCGVEVYQKVVTKVQTKNAIKTM